MIYWIWVSLEKIWNANYILQGPHIGIGISQKNIHSITLKLEAMSRSPNKYAEYKQIDFGLLVALRRHNVQIGRIRILVAAGIENSHIIWDDWHTYTAPAKWSGSLENLLRVSGYYTANESKYLLLAEACPLRTGIMTITNASIINHHFTSKQLNLLHEAETTKDSWVQW